MCSFTADHLGRQRYVAMLYLDVFDADGQWVRANVFVDERSNGTLFREGIIRHIRLGGVFQILTEEDAGAIKKIYSSQYLTVRIRLLENLLITENIERPRA